MAEPTTQPTGFSAQDELINISRRLRTIEERYTNLNRKVELNEKNMIDWHKNTVKELRAFMLDITDMKKSINELKEKVRAVVRSMQNLAKKDEVMVMRKYLDLWEPINFVTQEQVEKIVKDMLERKL
jgi:hypothetical protein